MVTMPFSVNRQAIQMILDRVAQDFYATPLDTEAPCVTGGGNYYTEESTVTQKDDRAVELLREQRESVAEQRAQRIVKSVQDLSVADLAGGTIVSFTKNYGGKRYTYVALKLYLGVGYDMWYLTGRSDRLTDLRFEEFLASDGGFDHFKLETIVAAVDDDE